MLKYLLIYLIDLKDQGNRKWEIRIEEMGGNGK